MCFAIRRSQVSPESVWDLSWPYWQWGTLSPSQGETTLCWRVFLSRCFTLPQALGRNIPKEWKEEENRSLLLPKWGWGWDLISWAFFTFCNCPGMEGCHWMFATVSFPGTVGFTKCCLQFTVALLHQYETCWPSFGPEWMCRWETSLDDWMVLPWPGFRWAKAIFYIGKLKMISLKMCCLWLGQWAERKQK